MLTKPVVLLKSLHRHRVATNERASMNIQQKNRLTMHGYKLYQNVQLDFCEGTGKVLFGTIVGFQYNHDKEICLVVKLVQDDDANPPDMRIINPHNNSVRVFVL